MSWSFWFWSFFAAVSLLVLGAAIEKEKGVVAALLEVAACICFAVAQYLKGRHA